MRTVLVAALLSATLAAQGTYVPARVFGGARHALSDFETMLKAIADADVVLVGEEHDDPNTHRLELALLEGLARRRTGPVIVSLEMFERDVQEPLDHFQMGHMDEQEFLKSARPWSNYAHDYKPLVDFAIARGWPLVASDVPRSIAAGVTKTGLAALKNLSGDQPKWVAKDIACPIGDAYFRRFAEAMDEHPAKDAPANAKATAAGAPKSGVASSDVERYYLAQCVKDETMGESIAQAYGIGAIGGKRPLVVHFTGAFHSDFSQGTAERVKRRLPHTRVVVLTMLPVADLDVLSPDKNDRRRADYLVYTVKDTKEKKK